MAGIVTPTITQTPVASSASTAVQSYKVIYDASTKLVSDIFESAAVVTTDKALFVSDPTDGSAGAVTSLVALGQCFSFIAAHSLLVNATSNMRFRSFGGHGGHRPHKPTPRPPAPTPTPTPKPVTPITPVTPVVQVTT